MTQMIHTIRTIRAMSLVVGTLATVALGTAQAAKAETREENAARLIAQAQNLNKQAAKLHGKAETSINAANRLAGQAHSLTLKVGSPQFKSAVAQYSGDLAQFKAHAEQYNAHLADFQKTIGECQATEAAYDKELKDYQLHVNLFHLPDLTGAVRPPHICGRLQMTQSESSRVANSVRADQLKIIAAQQNLNNEEIKLRQAQTAELSTEKKAVNASIREKHEQELAGEFGKLKQEYDLLKMENEALGGANSKVVASVGASMRVQAKVRTP
ncbi:MAG: hypothetical protein JST89_02645 [Cyanobacteria bacterium SZAS-4]|nr:hypothetical protein [Cyanobacteria bacterium SZAS-4]